MVNGWHERRPGKEEKTIVMQILKPEMKFNIGKCTFSLSSFLPILNTDNIPLKFINELYYAV